jgi:hypothetical protein
MIGSGASAGGRSTGIVGALLLGSLLTLRPAAADPTLTASRQATLLRLAAADDARLAAVAAALERAIDAGRRGAARIIQGETPPAADLEQAADAAARAMQLAADSQRADAAVDGTRLAVMPGQPALPAGPRSGDLSGIDRQLRDAAAASGPFVQRRHAAAETLEAMRAALAALDRGDAAAALTTLDRADAARRVVRGWPEPPVVLPFWLRTTDRMLSAARDIADATLAGDAAAAQRAGRAYRLAATHARRADTALALAISEAGSALASVPLRRLAEALDATGERRAAVASVLH